MTYVDDPFMVAKLKVLLEMIKGIRSLWTTTTDLEFVGKKAVRFLGMDVLREETSKGMVWKVTQNSCVRDLLQKEKDLKRRKIPITRD